MLCRVVLCRVVLCRVVLCCVVSCRVVLCCVVLCCVCCSRFTICQISFVNNERKCDRRTSKTLTLYISYFGALPVTGAATIWRGKGYLLRICNVVNM